MRRAWLVVAACGSAPARPPSSSAPPAADTACDASIAWADGAFAVRGLPCVDRDGARVVYASTDHRPRFPDLTIVLGSRADLANRIAVMEPHEGHELLDAHRAPTPELVERIRGANERLASLAPHLVALRPLAAAADGTFAGQGLDVTWRERGTLTIRRAGHVVHDADHSVWLEQLTACAPPSYLAAIWADAARGIALVEIAYRGSGGCTAMPELHVVAWQP